MKRKLAGFMVSVITAVMLLTPMVASANTVGVYKAYINWVNPGYVETSINVTYNGDKVKLFHGNTANTVDNLATPSATNYSVWCHYPTGNFQAILASYDRGYNLIATDSKLFYNP